MKSKKHSSSQEYAASIIDSILQTESEVPKAEKLDPQLLNYWCEEIVYSADRVWKEYEAGDRDYKFTPEEVEDLFEKAKSRLIAEVLENLLERDLVELGVRADGELVYKLSAEGQNFLNQRR